jgi:hypothetical protein
VLCAEADTANGSATLMSAAEIICRGFRIFITVQLRA